MKIREKRYLVEVISKKFDKTKGNAILSSVETNNISDLKKTIADEKSNDSYIVVYSDYGYNCLAIFGSVE